MKVNKKVSYGWFCQAWHLVLIHSNQVDKTGSIALILSSTRLLLVLVLLQLLLLLLLGLHEILGIEIYVLDHWKQGIFWEFYSFFRRGIYFQSISWGYEALQDTVYILLTQRCKNYCTTFCICWTPTLRLKMTATDPVFRWCRLLVLVLWFS